MSAVSILPTSAYATADALCEAVAERLAAPSGKAPRRSGAGWAVCCPAHADSHPSVTVRPGDRTDRALVACGAGCATETVLGSVGLVMADLFLDRAEPGTRKRETPGNGIAHSVPKVPKKPEPKRIPEDARGNLDREIQEAADRWREYAESAEIVQDCEHQTWTVAGVKALHGLGYVAGPTTNGRLRMIYRNAEGEVIGYADRATRPDQAGKKMMAASRAKRDLWPAPESLPAEVDTVLIAEGEKVALALWSADTVAVGIPGVNAWKAEDAHRFTRFSRVILLPDADPEGRALMEKVARDLEAVGVPWEIREAYPEDQDSKRDAADLLRDRQASGLGEVLSLMVEIRPDLEDAPEGPAPFPMFSPAEMMAWPDPVEIVQGMICEGDLFGIVAPFSSGKSAVALDLALHVATGRAWNGMEVRQAGVIYVAAENGPGYKKRVDAWCRVHGENPESLPLRIITARMKLDRPGDVERLRENVRQASATLGIACGWVVVDTVRRTMAGKENESDSFQAYVDACDLVRQDTGAVVGLVHHTPKNADDPRGRGSGVWGDALAPIFGVKATADPKRRTLTLSCRENGGGKPPKDLEPFDDFTMHLVGVDLGRLDRHGKPVTGVVAAEGRHPEDASLGAFQERAAWVREWVAENPERTKTAVAEAAQDHFQMKRKAAFALVDQMLQDGTLAQAGKGHPVALGQALFGTAED